MRGQRGASLLELLTVLALAGVIATITVIGSLGWIRRQAATSSVYHVQSMLQSGRAEAVARNRACQVRVEPQSGTLWLIDLNLPGSGDDVQIARLQLSRTTRFARPDGGDAVTLSVLPGGLYEATFEADGTVVSGAGGEIVLLGDDDYHRVTLLGAGAVRVDRWTPGGWGGG